MALRKRSNALVVRTKPPGTGKPAAPVHQVSQPSPQRVQHRVVGYPSGSDTSFKCASGDEQAAHASLLKRAYQPTPIVHETTACFQKSLANVR